MEKLKEHFHIIVIILGLGLVLPIAYYFLYALPKYNSEELALEREKYENEQNQILEAEAAKDEQANLLNSCVLEADYSYDGLWDNQCSSWKVQVDDAWADCRAVIYSWQTDESNKTDCQVSTPDYKLDANGVCLLPTTRSGQVEQDVSDMKDDCYKKYPL